MKDVKTLLLLTSLLVATLAYGQSAKSSAVAAANATAAASQSSASGTPSTPPTIASAIDREISIVEKEVVEAAENIRGATQLLLGGDATEASFKALPLADFRVMHLAVREMPRSGKPAGARWRISVA